MPMTDLFDEKLVLLLFLAVRVTGTNQRVSLSYILAIACNPFGIHGDILECIQHIFGQLILTSQIKRCPA